MNDAEINAAIAEACGWELHPYAEDLWIKPNKAIVVPRFCEDLNAMHEAEKEINDVGNVGYIIQLWELVRHSATNDYYGRMRAASSATARQRAEAFLRTIGKWKETQ